MEDNTAQRHNITRQMGQHNKDMDALLTLQTHGEIESEAYARKNGELQNRLRRLKLRLDSQEQQKTEIFGTPLKVLEYCNDLK